MNVPGGSSHDCFNAGNTCSTLMRSMGTEDQQIVAKFDGNNPGSNSFYGILILKDPSNWVRVQFINNGTTTTLGVDSQVAGSGVHLYTSSAITMGTSNLLRATKTGTYYSFEYSLDGGTTWRWVESANNSALSTFNITSFTPTLAGVFADNYTGAGAAAITANLDYFYIDDRYAGVVTPNVNIVSAVNNALQVKNPNGQVIFNVDSYWGAVTAAGRMCLGSGTSTNSTKQGYCNNALGIYGSGAATGGFATNANPDISESIEAAPGVEAGDVVLADKSQSERVVKSTHAYDPTVVGIISDGTSGFRNTRAKYSTTLDVGSENDGVSLSAKPLVLAGRVPVKVTDEGGAIVPGDPLTTSSTSGRAMKATHAGPTIGKALGFFDGHSGTVLALISVSYYSPSVSSILTSQNQDLQNQVSALGSTINTGSLNAGQLSVSGNASVAGNLTVGGMTNLADLAVGGHILTSGTSPTISMLQGNKDGQVSSSKIEGNDISGTISFITGDTPNANDLVKVSFHNPFTSTPRIVITPVGKDSALLAGYITDTTDAEFVLGAGQIPKPKTKYQFNYHILQ